MMKDETAGRVIELAMAIQQIPAPTFDEGERAQFVRAQFSEAGLLDVEIDLTGNVYGRLPGGDKPALIVSAHLDTVFARGTNLRLTRDPERIHGPGIGDNSMGVAALFGLAWALRETRLRGDIWFVANTCEEGLGDLRGMKAVVDRFGANVRGYLVIEGAALGHVYHRAVGVHRYRISARTAGGHAWSDYGHPSAVHELAALTSQIALLSLPVAPRTTLNVGMIAGGTSVNTLAAEASLELDMRSESPRALTDLVSRVDALIETANRPGVRVKAEVIGHRPAGEIPTSHPLIELAVACTRAQGMEPSLIGGSTDANVPLSRGIPAVVMGVTTGGGAHTTSEFIDVKPVARGMKALEEFLERVWGTRL
ncbi:MAG: M20/M25/M40 family metallo-hydrolase [Anaerolineaceae bacterium]|nr:MAG: M20/M25/M40 family metallo-hydrolase [Anaerolineaceae bacterium]